MTQPEIILVVLVTIAAVIWIAQWLGARKEPGLDIREAQRGWLAEVEREHDEDNRGPLDGLATEMKRRSSATTNLSATTGER